MIVAIETHHRGGCGVRVLTGVPGSLVGGKRHPLIGALLRSLYKSRVARQIITRWCGARLGAWEVPHRLETVVLDDAVVHLTHMGEGPPRVVFAPGTNFNAAAGLTIAAALARHWPTTIVNLPGQPGLGSGERPRGAHRGWYGRKLAQALESVGTEPVIALGHSLGGAVLLTCDSDRIAGRVLLAPAGIAELRLDARMMAPSLRWMLAPTPERTRAMLTHFTAPGTPPPEPIVEWLDLVAIHCRSTLAPPPLPTETLRRHLGSPLLVATGAHDRFLPPDHLGPAVKERLGLDLHVIADAGHLVTEERPEAITALVDLMLTDLDSPPDHV